MWCIEIGMEVSRVNCMLFVSYLMIFILFLCVWQAGKHDCVVLLVFMRCKTNKTVHIQMEETLQLICFRIVDRQKCLK